MKLNTILAIQSFQLLTILVISALRITIDKFSPHVDNIVSKASLRAKLILHCSPLRYPVLLTKAFCVFVRPLLLSGTQSSNKTLLELSQSNADSLKDFSNFSYTTRLSYLGLDSLQCRRTKADLSMCYKIINNYICTQVVSLFTFSSTKQTRGHSRKLDKSRVSSLRDGHTFSKRIVNVWNSLPERVVMSKSVGDFRHQVNKFHFCDYCGNGI